MLRSHTCGELSLADLDQTVVLCGWVQKARDLGGLTFIDLRDRYGITQLVFNMDDQAALCTEARAMGREYVISARGKVRERSSKNLKIPTGDIEVRVTALSLLSKSKTPPFTIEDSTDGGDELRAKFRYLDLRRPALKKSLELRSLVMRKTRMFLSELDFMEVETPVLIKSTPEGARDFIVPSRMNQGEFYALPQSPQTFKQLLMVSGLDRYFQIVKCFRDEDLRSDRQPEFTQIDCEMSFVTENDILDTFEGLVKHLFIEVRGTDLGVFPRMTYAECMSGYGSDKPDLRFGMRFFELTDALKASSLSLFSQAELILGIRVPGAAIQPRKWLDELSEFVENVAGSGPLFYLKYEGTVTKSSFDKHVNKEQLQAVLAHAEATTGDLVVILAGVKAQVRKSMSALRLELGQRLGYRDKSKFAPLWVTDFPLLEWDEKTSRFYAMHHPFTSPHPEDVELLKKDPASVRASAYDLVINGNEVGGGSIRIHERALQFNVFSALGFSNEDALRQFGFLLDAFGYGAPPHGGIALGLDRLCALLLELDSIRDTIAFPKNNAGRDTMIDSPSSVDDVQLAELGITMSSKLPS